MASRSQHGAPSRLVQRTGQAIVRYLRGHRDGATKDELCRRALDEGAVSPGTVQRALVWIRDDHDAPLVYDSNTRRWQLTDAQFTLPLTDPTAEDLTAVVLASALLGPIADDELNARLERLVEEMDERIRSKGRGSATIHPHALTATLTTGTVVDPELLATLLAAVGRHVVKIDYASPWRETQRFYEVEPWQLRIHDGALYLRAYSRSSGGPRSFRVAHISSARVVDGTAPSAKIPDRDRIWGLDPAFGIDEDRPDTAVVRVRGPMARWVALSHWHPEQTDVWIRPGELLERRVPYHSCRELARRLLSLGEAIDSIEPTALRDEVLRHADGLREHLGDGDASA